VTVSLAEQRAQAVAQRDAEARNGRTQVLVGAATCGQAAGALGTMAAFEAAQANRGLALTVRKAGCFGPCYLEPLVLVRKPGAPAVLYGNVRQHAVHGIVERWIQGDDPCADLAVGVLDEAFGGAAGARLDGIPPLSAHPMLGGPRLVLRNCGLIDPADFGHYLARDGYVGFERALRLAPQDVIDAVRVAGLRGRGGAGFPTATKWQICRDQPPGPRYLICNADEGDPGAFMNRSLIEGDPHALLEGMLIAGYALGVAQGLIYIRAEYPLAVRRLKAAIEQLREAGLLGPRIQGSDFSFELEIREGAGAFVCGEETALIASIEGERGMPRPKPPFPAVAGLWGRPTIINNVETLATVPLVLRVGGEAYAAFGSERSKGTKTFALAGKVKHTGLIEVPLGTSLRRIVFDVGGGILDDRAVKAVQTGGPSGGCVPASLLDTPVDYEALVSAGTIMGSGGLIVMDEDSCMVDVAQFFLSFTEKESCGKCPPCRVGTKQMLTILERITAGQGRLDDLERLEAIAVTVQTGSLCGLGQSAPSPVLTTLRYFRDEYLAHIVEHRCPAGVCPALVTYEVNDLCNGCSLCARMCPVDAITGERGKPYVIDDKACIRCGACADACNYDAIVVH